MDMYKLFYYLSQKVSVTVEKLKSAANKLDSTCKKV